MAYKARSFIFLHLAILVTGASINKAQYDYEADFKDISPVPEHVVTSQGREYWEISASDYLDSLLAAPRHPQKKLAKNVIIFIGDGMGATTTTAGRIYKGQRSASMAGEEYLLSFDKFPHVALAKTYNVDKQVPDSAGTATALFTGIKTRYKLIGLDARNVVGEYNEDYYKEGKLSSIMTWAQYADKRTGFVTTTRVTHATPAGTYAHSLHRDWECDAKVPEKYRARVKDIAKQLVEDEPGRHFNVILGGGQEQLGFKEQNDVESKCPRIDRANLTDEWLRLHPYNSTYLVVDSDGLNNVPNDAKHVMGLFSWSHLPYELVRKKKDPNVPSLSAMTEKALNILGKSPNGFVLMVEGGLIDVAHHDNMARAAMEEMNEFDNAIAKAVALSDADTLIIVTSDHSHSFTFNGYPARGNDIMGFADDEMPYLTLSYANGPGFDYHYSDEGHSSKGYPWRNLSTDHTRLKNPFYQHMGSYHLIDETHGGEDVPVYAYGPLSHMFKGVIEQSYIAHIISYAACIGPHSYRNSQCELGPLRYTATSSRAQSNFILPTILIYLIRRML